MKTLALLIFVVLLETSVEARDPFARARNDIPKFCKANQPSRLATCAAEQKEGLGRFVTIMAGFEDPGERVARKCMTSAKTGKYVNWVFAKKCMQSAAKGIPLGGTLRN